jgi:glycosyltransferase involved in cell wall biosynthesis
MDQSVVPLVAEYKNRFHIPAFNIFLDLPVHVIDVNSQDSFNYNYQYSQRFYYWLHCAMNIDSTIWISYVSGEEWRKRYKRDYEVFDYPISYDNYYDEVNESKTEDYVFGCHRVIRYKGSELLALAMTRTPYSFKHSFVSGNDQCIKEYKEFLAPIADRVELIEAAGEKQKMELYYHAKMVVYPQVTEWVSGLSILEGFSVKTAGICFDYPILRECYEDVAIYVKPRSYGELRKAIMRLWNDDSERQERATKGYELYKRRFTNQAGAEQLIKIMEKYVNG